MIADGTQVCASMGIRPGDLNLAVIPLGHSYGLGNLVIPLLIQGTPVLCVDAPLPSLLGEACQRWRPTVFPAVPTLLRALVRSGLERGDLGTLRLVISAGAPLGVEEARCFVERFGLRVHNFYGSTETGGICFDAKGEATLEGRSVGAVMDGVRIEFRGGDRFVVRGEAVQRPSGYSPADLGRLNDHGELVLLGRVGKQVKLAGRRLDLAGLETELCRVPGVRAAVAGLYSGRNDVLTAVVASDLGEAELRALLAGRMAPWRIPGRLRVLRELPLTPRGKVDRARCLALLNASAR
jgi:acyl-coenzyme A synthetase/AMP-(fatty) acid ligase